MAYDKKSVAAGEWDEPVKVIEAGVLWTMATAHSWTNQKLEFCNQDDFSGLLLLPAVMVQGGISTFGADLSSIDSYRDSRSLLSAVLPGLQVEMECPVSSCDHGGPWLLSSLIMHLNDTVRWTREQIADWLDTLDVDLTFPVPDEIPVNVH